MSDFLKHTCGIALIRLLKPITYLKEKYGTALNGLNQVFFLALGFMALVQAQADERVYQLRPSEKSEMQISHIGATGISARIHRGLVVRVESVIAGSPAADKFAPGEILTQRHLGGRVLSAHRRQVGAAHPAIFRR